MPRTTETAHGIAYPQLTRLQLDAIIQALLWAERDHNLGPAAADTQAATAYLIGFYTRRWGLPAVLVAAANRA